MYLFRRTRTANPSHLGDALQWAPEVAKCASTVAGLTVSPWASVYGVPQGTLHWTCRVDSQAELDVITKKLAADPAYQKIVAAGSAFFSGPSDDTLMQFVDMAGVPNSAKYASVVRAQCAPGRIADAMSWGVDINQHVAKLTNLPASMVRTMYGPWAELGWILLADDLSQFDHAEVATSGDPSYLERIDNGGELFIASSATQVLLRSLA